jgi:hypothetical protein
MGVENMHPSPCFFGGWNALQSERIISSLLRRPRRQPGTDAAQELQQWIRVELRIVLCYSESSILDFFFATGKDPDVYHI